MLTQKAKDQNNYIRRRHGRTYHNRNHRIRQLNIFNIIDKPVEPEETTNTYTWRKSLSSWEYSLKIKSGVYFFIWPRWLKRSSYLLSQQRTVSQWKEEMLSRHSRLRLYRKKESDMWSIWLIMYFGNANDKYLKAFLSSKKKASLAALQKFLP